MIQINHFANNCLWDYRNVSNKVCKWLVSIPKVSATIGTSTHDRGNYKSTPIHQVTWVDKNKPGKLKRKMQFSGEGTGEAPRRLRSLTQNARISLTYIHYLTRTWGPSLNLPFFTFFSSNILIVPCFIDLPNKILFIW